MEPCNILYRILDLIQTWREDSPYTRSINLIMQDPMMKVIHSSWNNQEILSNDISTNLLSDRKCERIDRDILTSSPKHHKQYSHVKREPMNNSINNPCNENDMYYESLVNANKTKKCSA